MNRPTSTQLFAQAMSASRTERAEREPIPAGPSSPTAGRPIVSIAAIDSLPLYESISSSPICEAAAQHDATRAAIDQARKDVTEWEQTREAAEWRGADAAEKARAEGRTEPKRSNVVEHDRKDRRGPSRAKDRNADGADTA